MYKDNELYYKNSVIRFFFNKAILNVNVLAFKKRNL